MSVFSVIYILLAAALLLVVMRSRLDLVTVCAVCFIVYSIYCIPGIGISGQYRPRLSETLYRMIYIQLVLIMVFSIFADRVERKQRKTVHPSMGRTEDSRIAEKRIETTFLLYTVIITAFALVNILSVGLSTFASGKENVWGKTNVLYIVSLYGTYPAFAYGIHKRKKLIWIPCLMVELSIFFAGSRAFLATMIIMVLCEFGSKLWKQRRTNAIIYAAGAGAIVFLLVYRMVDAQIMSGDISGALQTLSNPAVWKKALEFNEPRVIIANYDYVLTKQFRLPMGDVVYRFVDFVPGLTRLIPIQLQFPEYFSDWLVAEVHPSAGVGGTIWGESYAMMGSVGIPLFTILWLLFVKACSRHLDYPKPESYFVVSLGTYLAWYINRLDFNRVGQACKVTLFCFLIWAAIYVVLAGKLRIGKYVLGPKKAFWKRDASEYETGSSGIATPEGMTGAFSQFDR